MLGKSEDLIESLGQESRVFRSIGPWMPEMKYLTNDETSLT